MRSDLTMRAQDDFNRARSREFFSKLFSITRPQSRELLSLDQVRALIKPRSERYHGVKVVPIKNIVGSEGRYADFNKTFLPKYDYIKNRWVSVDTAHLQDLILPPIKLYKIGDVYFVRDGNHRVSVASAQGVEAIDAEVIELDSKIKVTPDMTHADLKQRVIAYERDRFFEETGLDGIIDREELIFSATGRYAEIHEHIKTHKYFLDINNECDTPFLEAAKSWYDTVFLPIAVTVQTENILSRFPGRTLADLYVWIVRRWDILKRRYGDELSIHSAASDFSKRFGKSLLRRLRDLFFPPGEKRR